MGTCFYKDTEQNGPLLLKKGTNCSEFLIPSGTNWTLMGDLGTTPFAVHLRKRYIHLRQQSKLRSLALA